MINRQVIAEFSEFFPDEDPKEIKFYLNGISQERLINACTFLLGFNIKGSEYNKIENFISMFFRKENLNFAIYILRKIPRKERNSIRAITPQSILSILEFAISNTCAVQIQTDAEEEISIFKVILIENVKFTKLQLLGFNSTEFILPERIPFVYLTTMFSDFDLVNININTAQICQTIKSFEIIDFIKTNNKTQDIYKNLLEEYKCKDSNDFLNKLINITTYIYGKLKEGSTYILLNPDEPNYESNKYFLDKFSINTNLDIKKELDFVNLRNRPLIKINELKYIAIHDSFTIDILHKGIPVVRFDLTDK